MSRLKRISFIDPLLDEDEWERVVSDGIVGELEHDVAHAIAYLEGIADWLCSPLGPSRESVAATPRLGWRALERARCLRPEIYATVDHYLEAAAILRDGWRP